MIWFEGGVGSEPLRTFSRTLYQRMARQIVYVSLMLVSACAHSSDDSNQIMKKIEAKLIMPVGAESIETYRRYYSWTDEQQTSVQAVYEHGGKPARLWLPSNEMPIILDGGCSVVTFTYDLPTDKVKNVACNGEA